MMSPWFIVGIIGSLGFWYGLYLLTEWLFGKKENKRDR